MTVVVAQTPDAVQRMLAVRVHEARQRLEPFFSPVLSLEMGGSSHFASPRGYATTLVMGGDRFHIRVADKFLQASLERQDAILRHEIGHLVDFSVPSHFLSSTIAHLPETPERRADAIATWLWGDLIRYDEDDVQTLASGTSPRPERLGL
jgi:hypothetical protein